MRKAFTLLELVFVIVVVGILAAVIIPSTRTNPVREAAIQLVSHIRYAQHLAMVDDKFNISDPTWYENRWRISFDVNKKYSIVSDINATDPMNPNVDLSDIDLDTDYSTTIDLSQCDANQTVSFDHLGRPMVDSLAGGAYTTGHLLTNTCIIILSSGSEDVNISIEPETGYAHINQD